MENILQINIDRKDKKIPILFSNDINEIDKLKKSLDYSSIVFFTDTNIYNFYKDYFDIFVRDSYFYIFQSGEESKSINSYLKAVDFLLGNNIDRKAIIIAIGGGVIGDISGFVASTYKRGVKVVHIPTTLLAMVDSSIGGKTGINYGMYKNQIGTFYQPEMIIICPEFLKTLPKLEMISGLGEVIKYGFTLDRSILWTINKYNNFDELFKNNQDMQSIIYKSIKCKVEIVEKDEKETFLREVLNFGHTVGHAFESYFNFELPHGIYVIFGMIVEMIISHLLFDFDFSNVIHLVEMIKANSLVFSKDFDNTGIISIMMHDKKNIKNQIRMVLLKNIEEYILGFEVKEDIINRALEMFKEIIL